MNNSRTGLLIDSMEAAYAAGALQRSQAKRTEKGPCTVTTVRLEDKEDIKRYGREKGTYVTIETDRVYKITDDDFETVVDVIKGEILSLMPEKRERILVAGLGNREITADSLGPKCIDRMIVTRSLESAMPQLIQSGGFSSVSAISANVFGVTGIESAELIDGIVSVISPSLVIVVDALATSSVSRLCKTIQISDTSIIPGGGVDNARKKISADEFGTKMISIGMPTVIDAATLLTNAGYSREKAVKEVGDDLIAMPMKIDSATDTAAKLIAFALNKALQGDIPTEDILKFLY